MDKKSKEYKYNIIFHVNSKGESESYKYIEEIAQKSINSKDARIKYKKIIEYIRILKICGIEVGEPYVKSIKNTNGLYELRPLRDRFFFIYEEKDTYVILNYFKKSTQKTPSKEIKKALKLIEERKSVNEKF